MFKLLHLKRGACWLLLEGSLILGSPLAKAFVLWAAGSEQEFATLLPCNKGKGCKWKYLGWGLGGGVYFVLWRYNGVGGARAESPGHCEACGEDSNSCYKSLCCGGTMELEEQGLNPRDIVKHVVRTAIAATRERNISIQAIVADDVPTLVVS